MGEQRLFIYASGHLEKVTALGTDDAVHNWFLAGGCVE
jgi:hypothetical protein